MGSAEDGRKDHALRLEAPSAEAKVSRETAMKIGFRVDGRIVEPSELGVSLVHQIEEVARHEVEARVAGLRCPIHDTPPTLVDEGIECCCSELEVTVRKAFQP